MVDAAKKQHEKLDEAEPTLVQGRMWRRRLIVSSVLLMVAVGCSIVIALS